MVEFLKRAIIALTAALLTFCILPLAVTKVLEDANPKTQKLQTEPDEADMGYTGEKNVVNLQNADIRKFIKAISEFSGKEIIVPDSVSGKVTLKLRNVSWAQALDIVLSSQGLGYEDSGNILTVYELSTLLRNHRCMDLWLASTETTTPLVKKVFTPKYAPISKVAEELKTLKSECGKMLHIGNDIYVEDEPGAMAAMAQVFMHFDRPRVFVDARIIEANVSFIRDMDVKWRGCAAKSPTSTEGGGKSDDEDSVAVKPSLAYGFLDKDTRIKLDAQLNTIVNGNIARTISALRFMAANDREVTIGPPSWLHAYPEPIPHELYRFNIKPHIEGNDQLITLDIEFVNDMFDLKRSEVEPVVIVSEVTTKIVIKDGETVAIGGLAVASDHDSEEGVTDCRKLPFWDWMINNRSSANIDSEMFLVVTATIIPVNI